MRRLFPLLWISLLPACREVPDIGSGRIDVVLERLRHSKPEFTIEPGVKVWQGVENAPGKKRVRRWVAGTMSFWRRWVPEKRMRASLARVRLVFLDISSAKVGKDLVYGVSYRGWALVRMRRTIFGAPDWEGVGETAMHELGHYAVAPLVGWTNLHHILFEMLGFDK